MKKANEIIKAAGEAAKRSKMSSMVQFVSRSNATPEQKATVLNSRGEDRQAYLRQYVAYTVAKTTGRLRSSATHSTEKAERQNNYFWNAHQLDKEVGAETAEAWKQKLPWRPDAVTGLDSEALRQHIVPVQWFESSKKDSESICISGEKQPDKTELF